MAKELSVLSVSTSDLSGGAARAAYRIHKGVRLIGVDSHMFVKEKISNDDTIIPLHNYLPKTFFYKPLNYISTKIKNKIQQHNWSKYTKCEDVYMSDLRSIPIHGALQKLDYDILQLHWIGLRFLDLKELKKIKKPIIWTLHDCWGFTGICHSFYNCEQYKYSCGNCPFLNSKRSNDLSRIIWKQKKKIYENLNLHIVCPSKWLADCVKTSSLLKDFPVSVIPNCLDTDVFTTNDKIKSCEHIKLNPSKRRILFGAMQLTNDKIKGFDKFLHAISFLEKKIDCTNLELLFFGANSEKIDIETNIPFSCLGYLSKDKDIVDTYNASHVMVVPSYYEVFGQTASEAMACGVPVVAFNCSGIKEVVDHKITGYLAEPYDAEDLANGIIWCLENNKTGELSSNARKKVLENYTLEKVAENYVELFKSLVE